MSRKNSVVSPHNASSAKLGYHVVPTRRPWFDIDRFRDGRETHDEGPNGYIAYYGGFDASSANLGYLGVPNWRP